MKPQAGWGVISPTGYITLGFVGVYGADVLSSAFRGGRWEVAVAGYQDLARALLAEKNGYECGTVGSAMMVAFGNPIDAVNWSAALHTRLLSVMDDDDPMLAHPLSSSLPMHGQGDEPGTAGYGYMFRGLRLSVGLHAGKAKSDNYRTGFVHYTGVSVRIAAMAASAASGGQTLASQAVYKEIAACLFPQEEVPLDAPVSVSHLGWHAFKDPSVKGHPVQLFQVMPSALSERAFAMATDFASKRMRAEFAVLLQGDAEKMRELVEERVTLRLVKAKAAELTRESAALADTCAALRDKVSTLEAQRAENEAAVAKLTHEVERGRVETEGLRHRLSEKEKECKDFRRTKRRLEQLERSLEPLGQELPVASDEDNVVVVSGLPRTIEQAYSAVLRQVCPSVDTILLRWQQERRHRPDATVCAHLIFETKEHAGRNVTDLARAPILGTLCRVAHNNRVVTFEEATLAYSRLQKQHDAPSAAAPKRCSGVGLPQSPQQQQPPPASPKHLERARTPPVERVPVVPPEDKAADEASKAPLPAAEESDEEWDSDDDRLAESDASRVGPASAASAPAAVVISPTESTLPALAPTARVEPAAAQLAGGGAGSGGVHNPRRTEVMTLKGIAEYRTSKAQSEGMAELLAAYVGFCSDLLSVGSELAARYQASQDKDSKAFLKEIDELEGDGDGADEADGGEWYSCSGTPPARRRAAGRQDLFVTLESVRRRVAAWSAETLDLVTSSKHLWASCSWSGPAKAIVGVATQSVDFFAQMLKLLFPLDAPVRRRLSSDASSEPPTPTDAPTTAFETVLASVLPADTGCGLHLTLFGATKLLQMKKQEHLLADRQRATGVDGPLATARRKCCDATTQAAVPVSSRSVQSESHRCHTVGGSPASRRCGSRRGCRQARLSTGSRSVPTVPGLHTLSNVVMFAPQRPSLPPPKERSTLGGSVMPALVEAYPQLWQQQQKERSIYEATLPVANVTGSAGNLGVFS